jgi:hypothetical protein
MKKKNWSIPIVECLSVSKETENNPGAPGGDTSTTGS